MASINGVSLKKAKTFSGRHGVPLAQADVYYNGTKLGAWSQDYSGGEDEYEFLVSLLDDVLKKYRQAIGNRFASLGLLLEELFNLTDTEKVFKKAVKDGFPSMVVISMPWEDRITKCRTDDKDVVLYLVKDQIEAAKAEVSSPDDVTVKIYTSLDDFTIEY